MRARRRSWSGASTNFDAALADADHVVRIERLHFSGTASRRRCLSAPAASSSSTAAPVNGRSMGTTRCRGRRDLHAPALRVGIDKLRFVSQDIGGGFGNKITSSSIHRVRLLARKLNRPVRDGVVVPIQHTANTHGNERTFLDVTVPVEGGRDDARLLSSARTTAGLFRATSRSLHHLVQGDARLLPLAVVSIRVDFTQVCTKKSPVAPATGATPGCIWLTERIVDIVAGETRPRPDRGAEEELRQTRGVPVRNAERVRLRLGRLRGAASTSRST